MKKIILCLLCLATFSLTVGAQSSKKTQKEKGKAVVAYFSATGTTAKIAKQLATQGKADLLEIEPEKKYTKADLDWHDKTCRSTLEMQDATSRPAILTASSAVDKYQTVYLGYPIWWGVAPRVVNSFIEKCNLTGKRVILFATSGSSTIGKSVSELKKTYPKVNFVGGRLLNNPTKEDFHKALIGR